MPKKDDGTLNDMQEMFCREYVIDFNGTQAAIRAGYSERSSAQIAWDLLRKHEIQELIQAEIKRLHEATGITAQRIREELAKIAFSDMRDFARWGPAGVILSDSEELEDGAAACVSEVSQTITKEGGSIRFKLHPKLDALEKLMREHPEFSSKVEHTGRITHGIDLTRLSDAELEQMLELAAKGTDPNELPSNLVKTGLKTWGAVLTMQRFTHCGYAPKLRLTTKTLIMLQRLLTK